RALWLWANLAKESRVKRGGQTGSRSGAGPRWILSKRELAPVSLQLILSAFLASRELKVSISIRNRSSPALTSSRTSEADTVGSASMHARRSQVWAGPVLR